MSQETWNENLYFDERNISLHTVASVIYIFGGRHYFYLYSLCTICAQCWVVTTMASSCSSIFLPVEGRTQILYWQENIRRLESANISFLIPAVSSCSWYLLAGDVKWIFLAEWNTIPRTKKKKTEKRRESKVMRSSRSTRQDKLVWFGPRHGTECKPISLNSHRQIIITERNRRKHVSANSECFHFSQIFFLNRINWIFCVKITIIIIISGVLSFFFVQKLWDKYFSFRQSANNNITSKWQRRCTVDRKNLEFLARNLQRKNHCGTLADSCCKSHLLVLFSIETFTSLDTDRARAER